MKKISKSSILTLTAIFITLSIFNLQAEAIESPPKCYRFNNEAVPYGYYRHHWRKTGYGQRSQIRNVEEAISLVQEFYKTAPVNIVPIRESYRFYKLEIQDENKNILDIVIVDKFSGRIRSIY